MNDKIPEGMTEEEYKEGIKTIKFLKALNHPIRRMIVEFVLNENAKQVREKIIERDRELLEKLNTGSKKTEFNKKCEQ